VSIPILFIGLKPLTTSFYSVKGEARHRFIGHITGANELTWWQQPFSYWPHHNLVSSGGFY